MPTLTQPRLFSWPNLERSSEILRLAWIFQILPDQRLLETLCRMRKKKRNDYPLEDSWHSVLAGVLLGHETIAKLIRELRRNKELREACGFEPLLAERAVPPDYVFSRFFVLLLKREALVNAMFDELLERVAKLLPTLGRHLAVDSKALPVLGSKPPDADMGSKAYEGEEKQGAPLKRVLHWFGYKLHLIVDADFELPLAYEVTKASEADSPRLIPMIETLSEKHAELYERIESAAADKAYDDGADKAALWQEHGIVPLIPPRDMSKTEPMKALDPQRSDTVYIDPTGKVCCKIAPFEKEESKAFATMEFRGFEKSRDTLKFRCPAAAFGLECKNRAACRCRPQVREGKYGRTVRIPLSRAPRLLTPVYSHSRRFRIAYKQRTSVERVNSRLDNVYGFERSFARSREKMAVRVGLALIVMLASALAWIEAGKHENVRCLLRAA